MKRKNRLVERSVVGVVSVCQVALILTFLDAYTARYSLWESGHVAVRALSLTTVRAFGFALLVQTALALVFKGLSRGDGKRPHLGVLATSGALGIAAMLVASSVVESSRWLSERTPLTIIGVAIGLWAAVFVLDVLRRASRGRETSRFVRAAALGFLAISIGVEYRNGVDFRHLYQPIHDVVLVFTTAISMLALSAWLRGLTNRGLVVVATLSVLAALVTMSGFSTSSARDPRVRHIVINELVRGARLDRWQRTLLPERIARIEATPDDADRRWDARLDEYRRQIEVSRLPAARTKRHSILWVTIDTVRADHLSILGYERPTSPNIDAFAGTAALFRQCRAQYPITHLSAQSMFYSLWPEATPLHRTMTGQPISPEPKTIAEHLRANGYFTASIPAIPEVALNQPHFLTLTHGFESVNQFKKDGNIVDGPEQTAAAITLLERMSDRPFFLWLHLMEPHASYVLHEQHDFGTRNIDRYDSEIAAADVQFGRMLAALDRLELTNDTIVVVSADHGEAHGEHHTYFHGSTLYDEQIRVPLIIRVPGRAPRVLDRHASNVDIVPTLLDAIGVAPSHAMAGKSLMPSIEGGDEAVSDQPDFAYAELPDSIPVLSPANADRRAVLLGRWKLIENESDQVSELYDLAADPEEKSNVASDHPEVVTDLRALIGAIRREYDGSAVAGDRPLRSFPLPLDWPIRPPDARIDLLRQALLQSDIDRLALIGGRFSDPDEHWTVKDFVVREAPPIAGKRMVAELLEILDRRSEAASVESALLALDQMPAELADKDVRDALARVLPLGGSLARHAATLLAVGNDDRGRDVFACEFHSPDRRIAVRAAANLARLGDNRGTKVLIEALNRQKEPEIQTAIIEGLTVLEEPAGIPIVVDLCHDTYMHHDVKRAALRYLMRFDRPIVEAGLARLLHGFDAEFAEEVAEVVDQAYGSYRCDQFELAARRRASALELVSQGQLDDAADAARDVVKLLGEDEASAWSQLLLARIANLRGDAGEIHTMAHRYTGMDLPESLRRAMTQIASLDDANPSPFAVDAMSLEWESLEPISPYASEFATVTLTNRGSKAILGGRWTKALKIISRVTRKSDGKWWEAPPANIDQGGIEPGESLTVSVPVAVPIEDGDFVLTVRGEIAATIPLEFNCRASLEFSRAGPSTEGMRVADLARGGAELLREWTPRYRMPAGEIEIDGSVSWLPLECDPWLVSPVLRNEGRELSVRFRIRFGRPRQFEPVNAIELYWNHETGDVFEASRHSVVEVPSDDAWHEVEFKVPAVNGVGARRLRIDPGQLPRIVYIRDLVVEPR